MSGETARGETLSADDPWGMGQASPPAEAAVVAGPAAAAEPSEASGPSREEAMAQARAEAVVEAEIGARRRVLAYWFFAEALSPPEVPRQTRDDARRRKVLLQKPGDRIEFTSEVRAGNVPPWADPAAGAADRHFVRIGLVDRGAVAARMAEAVGAKGADAPESGGRQICCLAAFDVNGTGEADERTAQVASFGWAAHAKDAEAAIGMWPMVPSRLTASLAGQLAAGRALTTEDLARIAKSVAAQCGSLLDGLVDVETVAVVETVRRVPKTEAEAAAETKESKDENGGSPINSFLLPDLLRAYAGDGEDGVGAAMAAYLGAAQEDRLDVADPKVASEAGAARYFPSARWPSPARPALMQQVAVNLASGALAEEGLFSVNGPPGTGKTTLLKDVVAHVIVERAKRMAAFNDPRDGFPGSGDDGARRRWRHLHPSLLGHEIVVASSNNAAVENVTKELPDGRQMAFLGEGAETHFKALSDRIADAGDGTWGLVSAALGNLSNRNRFVQRFWWGRRHRHEPKDFRPPTIRAELQSLPLAGWDEARARLREALARVGEERKALADGAAGDPEAAAAADPLGFQLQPAAWSEGFAAARQEAFFAALAVHRAFLSLARNEAIGNLWMAMDVLTGKEGTVAALGPAVRDVMATLHMAVPVVSTTFASFGSMYAALGKGSIGWVLVDEAGQAPPQAAAGAAWRAKRLIAVGDPLQIEPVTSLPPHLSAKLRAKSEVPALYDAAASSVQAAADAANPYGSNLFGRWTGVPLRVHRRCVEPMFSISNETTYNGRMFLGIADEEARRNASGAHDRLGSSRWIHVAGEAENGHYVPAEGEAVLHGLRALASGRPGALPACFVISPFRSVAWNLRRRLAEKASLWSEGASEDEVREWAQRNVGTIHTFQGRECDTVFLVLGGDKRSKGAVAWASDKPNILNVAVSRAKLRLYVIGDRGHWGEARHFADMARMLDEWKANPDAWARARIVRREAFADPAPVDAPETVSLDQLRRR